jgi:arylsulfatase K
MVGAYVAAVAKADPSIRSTTVFIVSSDHGDMQMEHAQFYKMTAFEASTRIPIVISGAGVNHVGNVNTLVSLVDLMPTFLDLAGLTPAPKFVRGALNDPMAIDGVSLVPLLQKGDAAADTHPDHIMSQVSVYRA